ncbi:Nrd1 complex RNA-binding subunit [Tyrophagus putrescentiae]|nr:Nrd1 complex RNA-binding subunit [Tyrophagus putrescentiae]
MSHCTTLAESIISDKSAGVKIATQAAVQESALKFLNANTSAGAPKQQELLRAESDKFDYKLLRLNNGVRVLLISDPSYKELASVSSSAASSKENVNASSDVEMSDHEGSDADSVASSASGSSAGSSKKGNDKQAAIAIGVHAGGFQDPDDFPGMAHMLEHMISMGSEAYPRENALDDFLSSRGGYQNAHTEVEYTIYEIKVHRNHFKEAINIIGKAFVAPLLRPESIEREIKPVDTEFVQASNYDDVRAELILNENANQAHPIHRFIWGNRKSLITEPTAKGLDIRQSLVDFFNRNYYPENIVVAVQSQEPLANLEEWTKVFAEVKPRSPAVASTPPVTVAPFDNAKFNRLYAMEAINSGTKLLVHWALPPVLDKYLFSSFDYLCALIGHEGKGSLIAELRRRDLAIDLLTESQYFCTKNNSLLSIFGVEIELTPSGARRLEEVVALLFEYITVIRTTGAQEYFYRENQTIAHKSFNNKSERSPMENVVHLATNMMHYPVEHTLSGHSLYYHYDKAAIDDLLAHFLPHNVNLIRVGGPLRDDLQTLTEKWMSTKYQVSDIPAAWIERANQCHGQSEYFHYPKPNNFIATRFDLLRDTLPPSAPERRAEEYPMVVQQTDRLTVWYKPDFKFNLPKAAIQLHILNPCFDGSLQELTLADVFFEYVIYKLKEDTYDALAAELDWTLQQTYNGISIITGGFNHKLADLVILILKRLKTIDFEPTILESMKVEVAKHYNNAFQDQETFNTNLRLLTLLDRSYSYLQRWPLIGAIDRAQMEQYKAKVLSNLSVELLVQGNFSHEETIQLGKRVEEILQLPCPAAQSGGPPYPRQKTLVRELPVGVSRLRALTLSEKNAMSLVICYFQLMPYTLEASIYLSLFIELIDELCFNTLRTIEGLGYRVGCGENDTSGILGFNVQVASNANKFQCSFMEERIMAFVDTSCREHLATLSQAKFEEFVSSALKRRQAPDVSLGKEVKRNMDEICSFDYCFDRLKREIAQLKKITLEGLQQWTAKHIFVPASERKQLTVQVVGNGEVSLAECTTADGSAVSESMIPRENSQGQCKPLLLLQAKENKNFIMDVEAFRKQLKFYPPQPSVKDLK